MRIIIDMQGAQTANRFRDIGRYTLALVTEMVRQRNEHDIVLILNAAYPDSIEAIRAAFADLLPFDAIRVFEAFGPVGGHDVAHDARRKAAELMYEAFMAELDPDVIFIPSLFEEFGGEAVTTVHSLHNTIPTAVTLHDLIPLIHRSVYLQDSVMERWYFSKLDHLRRADLFLSVSSASGREAIQHLNVPETSVVTVYNACDAQFFPIDLTDKQRAHLKTTYGIDHPFVMNTGGIDYRKNIDGLFRAFASLPREMRHAHALVLVGREVADQKSYFLHLAEQVGLQENELVFTGYVPDQDLALLYNACTLLVFPSWHEGFGLPVLEAMACGTAVIAANSSSLPEVVGRADALFAPRDDVDMANKIAEVLGNSVFRQELERHGLKQVKKFSWEKSAQRAWAALHALHAQHQQRALTASPPSKRLRLAFVSPLPPEKTGIADYAVELLPELARHYDITVIVEQAEVADAWVQANAPIRNVAWFREHAQQFDRVIYQFGNAPFHSHMFELLAEIPGMVVLHDFHLSDLIWYRDAHGPAWHAWARALQTGHGWRAVIKRFQASTANEVHELVSTYPCNLIVLQQAHGIIVHSNLSRRLARQFYGAQAAKDWVTIPLLRQPAQQIDKALARKQLGMAENAFVVCSFGGLNPTKMNHRLLDAWIASPLAQDAACHLVFVGENHGGEYGQDLLQTIVQSPAKDRITITGWTEATEYRTWLAAADVGVQLRTLSRGETSAAVLDCMNYGLPTIVNANGSMADLPADAVLLLPDEFTEMALIEGLTRLYEDVNHRAELGVRAKVHIHTHHNPRHCAWQYAEAIESTYHKVSTGLYGLSQTLPRLIPSLPVAEPFDFASTLATNFPPKICKPQLLLDVSALVKTDLWSGIERVTRALLREIALGDARGWRIEPVYAVAGQPGYRYAHKFMSRFLEIPDDWAEDTPVLAWQGDQFLGLDFEPGIVFSQERLLQDWQRRGVGVYFVVHDLLPVTMSDAFPDGARDVHQRWLQTISQFDGVFCVSRHVTNEFYEWLQVFGAQRVHPFKLNWFHHGADVDNSAPSLGQPADALQTLAIFKARPTFLMVGTIEPRKGYLQTLQAFDALWAQGGDVNLVIVGKEGWKPLPDDQRRDIPQTMNALRNHPELGKRLFWLEGISDEYLEQVYAHAACLIGASYDEGFGLPLIEAARHGVPLLVRDIPVFREVTDGHAYYFADSREPQAISGAIQQWLTQLEQGTHPRSTAMPHQTWHDSAQQVLGAILDKTPPYKTWQPDGVRRYWDTDPRLHIEVGKRSDKSIQTTGKAGTLIYGAYEQYEVGLYRVIISGRSEHWGEQCFLDVSINGGKEILARLDMAPTHKLGHFITFLDFEIAKLATDLEVRFCVEKDSELELDDFIISEFVELEDKKEKIQDYINKKIVRAQSPSPLQDGCDEVRILQTCDQFRYKQLLDVSSKFNKKCSISSNIEVRLYHGIKYGIFPHHATYNRTKILHDWIDEGFRGWALYIDADSIICKPDYDFVLFFTELRKNNVFLWMSKDNIDFAYHDFNAGVFAIDLNDVRARQIITAWDGIYSEYYLPRDYLWASRWDDILNDQDSLSKIMRKMVSIYGERLLDDVKYGELQAHWKMGWEISTDAHPIFFSALRSEAGGISAEDEMDARINAIKKRIAMLEGL